MLPSQRYLGQAFRVVRYLIPTVSVLSPYGSPERIRRRRHHMVATSTKSLNRPCLIRTQRPAEEFFEDAQPADQGEGRVVHLGNPNSLEEVKRLLNELVLCVTNDRGGHDWRSGCSPTESVCPKCGLGVDTVHGSALVFSEESCRVLWTEWRAGVRDLTDVALLNAMTDADVAVLTQGREGWVDSKRPKHAVYAELRVLYEEIERRGLDWWGWECRQERFYDACKRKSEN